MTANARRFGVTGHADRRHVKVAERHRLHDRCAGDTGKSGHPVRGIDVDPIALRADEGVAKIERHEKQPRRRKAQILLFEALQAAHEQSGAHEQERAQRHLRGDEHPLNTEAATHASAARLELGGDVAARRLTERREPGDEARDTGGDDRRRQGASIDEPLRWREIG